jgi:hypothetical protein
MVEIPRPCDTKSIYSQFYSASLRLTTRTRPCRKDRYAYRGRLQGCRGCLASEPESHFQQGAGRSGPAAIASWNTPQNVPPTCTPNNRTCWYRHCIKFKQHILSHCLYLQRKCKLYSYYNFCTLLLYPNQTCKLLSAKVAGVKNYSIQR